MIDLRPEEISSILRKQLTGFETKRIFMKLVLY